VTSCCLYISAASVIIHLAGSVSTNAIFRQQKTLWRLVLKTDGKFYLGRIHDLKKGKTSTKPLLYDPDDLTTHGVVFGMTGSGKTGLCIGILEEAALNDIPALMIDPKGDITNALLHFPELRPADFEPWINADEVRRDKLSTAEAAKKTASLWKNGLADWDIKPSRIKALSEAAEFAIFTPGSDAGIPVSILASLQAPDLDWKKHHEIILERIASTATAILGLVGFDDIDPVKSREHILLASLFEKAWSKGEDLDLGELILQVQNPPVKKLGVFEIDKFFPPKERAKLALQLNNILAAPGFQNWLEGEPLDIQNLLYTKEGKPRHSVFTLSHLSDPERMFFVTLLYSSIETWMRGQSGTGSLRALIYFDEIHGYLPPVAQPPSKGPMLRMLKQARAFGVGQLLATQNPVDVDYKGLSNAGTWFIGRLQAERDKERLLDGLEGASQSSFKRSDYDKIISSLEKRVFLLHNVHEKKPSIFHTRWAMNYLAGPLTRVQIPAINALVGAKIGEKPVKKSKSGNAKEKKVNAEATNDRPVLPTGLQEFFLPATLGLEAAAEVSRRSLSSGDERLGLIYRPALFAQAQVRYLKASYDLDSEEIKAVLVEDLQSGEPRWEDFAVSGTDERSLEKRPGADAIFAPLEGSLAESAKMKSLEKEFANWIYRESKAKVWHNEALKFYGNPELSEEDFLANCEDEAKGKRDAEIKKAKAKYKKSLKSLQKKLSKEHRELDEDKAEASQRRMEEYGTYLDTAIGLFKGRSRSLSTPLSKRRMRSNAQADVQESEQMIEELEDEMEAMGEEIKESVEEIHDRWDELAADISQISVAPLKKDIYVSLFGIAWMPYHRVLANGREMEIAAYELK